VPCAKRTSHVLRNQRIISFEGADPPNRAQIKQMLQQTHTLNVTRQGGRWEEYSTGWTRVPNHSLSCSSMARACCGVCSFHNRQDEVKGLRGIFGLCIAVSVLLLLLLLLLLTTTLLLLLLLLLMLTA